MTELPAVEISLQISGTSSAQHSNANATIVQWRLDDAHGNPYGTCESHDHRRSSRCVLRGFQR